MNPVTIILALCALANFVLVIYVLGRRHTKPLHFAFAGIVASISLWNFSQLGITLFEEGATLLLLGRLTFAFSVLIGVTYVIFTWCFPEIYHKKPPKWVALCFFLIASVFFGLSFTDLIQDTVEYTTQGKQPGFGKLHPPYMLFMLLAFAWGTANLISSRIRTASGRERMQVNYVLGGFILAFLTSYVGNFILPFLGISSDYYLVLSAVGSLIWVATATYAIVRYRLLDIGVAIRNVLIHGVTAGILIVAIAAPFVLDRVLIPIHGPPQMLLVIFAAAILAYMMPNLHRRVTHFVDHRIFRGRYDHETALIKFSQSFRSLQPREEIAGIMAREIPIILQSSGASVYLWEMRGSGYRLIARNHLGNDQAPPRIDSAHSLGQELRQHGGCLIREDIAYAVTRVRDKAAILEAFDQVGAQVVVLLGAEASPAGLLFIGEKTKDNVYTTDDLQLLHALVSQVETALDNARLYEEILASQRQYKTILGHMQRGVLSVNSDLEIVTLNQCAAEILGLKNPEAAPKMLEDISPAFAGVVRKTLESGRNQSPFEITLRHKGRTFPCECETSVLSDSQHRVTGAVLVFQDLTERKRFEEEVRRMDRLASVGTLAAGIAHEIKNPLVSIQTFAQLLPERHKDTEFRENFGGVVRQEIQRINKLIQSLLDFARPKRAMPGPVHIREIAERAGTLLENQLRRAHTELEIDVPDDLPTVTADAEQLYQVVFNLIQNAMQAMDGPSGRITVTARPDKNRTGQNGSGMILLQVKDTGRGIEKKDLEHIFDPFYSTKENGSGLGLSICHGIIEEHNARIEVQSTLGEGTTFSIRIPSDITKKTNRREMTMAQNKG